MNFEGRVFLVSGASSGIGEAAAVALQKRGAKVFGIASGTSSLAKAKAAHPAVEWVAADVAKRAEVDRVVKDVLASAGRLDGLVNNAGIYEFAPLEASNDDMIHRQFEVNVYGTLHLTQAALPALKASKGTIVNVSSTSARKALAGQSIYAATKAAIEALTRTWALELGKEGIRVNAIAPGPTMTPGIAKIPMAPEMFEKMKEQVLASIPLGRTGSSEEVAHWILAFSDPAVTWMTGQIVGIDGGMNVT